MQSYPENAPVNDSHVEGFISGSISAKNIERDRIYEKVIELPHINLNFEEYVKLDDVLKVLKRP